MICLRTTIFVLFNELYNAVYNLLFKTAVGKGTSKSIPKKVLLVILSYVKFTTSHYLKVIKIFFMKFGIITERKNPPDKRVVLSPDACKKLLNKFKKATIFVEPSSIRTFKDADYKNAGITVSENMEDCDVLLGVKEVPVVNLIPNKKYFFFSHTIKKQPYNRDLLLAVLDKNIELYDHEVITNEKEQRLVAFGRYAGIVGAYNGFRTFGLKSNLFDLPKAENLTDQEALISELKKIKLPNIKILLTGKGRVGNGAKEMLDAMNLKKVTVASYLSDDFDEPVYCQIDASEYNKRKDGVRGNKADFFANPEEYKSNFLRFTKVTDFYIAGHFYADGAPYLFSRKDAKHPEFKIKVVADVSCDIDGPVACTIKPSTIADPIYGYDPETETETDFKNPDAIAVMAVDNLPCELPRDASVGFGEAFLKNVIPAFFDNDKNGVLERARMTQGGKLTKRFNYLQEYIDGK
jgi:alanine dehydrogenase